ncbi:MAG: hypothetical protein RLZZ50_2080 [Verrucomicrobiota bacterium]
MEWSRKIRDLAGRARAWSSAGRAAAAACGLAALGLLAWAWRLWPEWQNNPDLSHGFFALPIIVVLWRRAREDVPASRGLGAGVQFAASTTVALGLLGSALFAAVYAAATGWPSAPTLFYLGAGAAAAATLAVVLAAGRDVRWISPGWPALVIPLAILLSAPLPPATYERLMRALQEFITVGVVETLRLGGIPAMRSGNIINLGNTSVGVEEACSGMRSLVSCVLAGLVLSALMLRSPGRRAVLVLAAAPLALAGNFLRSLTLTLLARNGVDIAGAWHDGLGFAVLGVTTAALAWIATALEQAPPARTVGIRPDACAQTPRGLPRAVRGVALTSLALAAGWISFVAWRTERGDEQEGPAPQLARLIPERPRAAGWQVSTRDDLLIFADALQTRNLLERTYERRTGGGVVWLTAYAAWWPAGGTTVSAVAAHTPEACWPGAGWSLDAAESARRDLPLGDGREAGEAEQRAFVSLGQPHRVWFWHLVADKPFRPFDPRSWRDQLALFFREGVRKAEPQAFVRLSSNRPWSELKGEPLVAELLEGFAELGVPLRPPAAPSGDPKAAAP